MKNIFVINKLIMKMPVLFKTHIVWLNIINKINPKSKIFFVRLALIFKVEAYACSPLNCQLIVHTILPTQREIKCKINRFT